MDYLQQQFMSDARKLLKQLERITRLFQEQNETIAKTSSAYIETCRTPPVIRAEINISEGIRNQPKTDNTQQDRRERTRLSIEKVGAVLLLVYVIFTASSWWELNTANINQSAAIINATAQGIDQLRLSRQTMEIDQRAWLKVFLAGQPIPAQSEVACGAGGTNIQITIAIEQPILMPIRIANTGKTAAQKVVGYAIVEVVKMGKEPDIPDHPLTIPLPGLLGQPTTVPPNVRRYGLTAFATSLIYPGDCDDSLAKRVRAEGRTIAVYPLSKREFDSLREGGSYLAAYGRVTYIDVFGVSHWTQFCKSIRADASGIRPTQSMACANYTAVDNNTH
jgi:hypothetical protein